MNGDNNDPKTDIQWIKEALKEIKESFSKMRVDFGDSAVRHGVKHNDIEKRLRAVEIGTVKAGFWGSIITAILAVGAYLGLGK